jgi:hypothetical protein
MKSKLIYMATVVLMVSGMALAQGSSPGTMDSQSGSSTASPAETGGQEQGNPPADNTHGASPAGETPATGEIERHGIAAPDVNSTGTEPKSSTSDSANTPSYSKPITSSDSSEPSSDNPNSSSDNSNPSSTSKHEGTGNDTEKPK